MLNIMLRINEFWNPKYRCDSKLYYFRSFGKSLIDVRWINTGCVFIPSSNQMYLWDCMVCQNEALANNWLKSVLFDTMFCIPWRFWRPLSQNCQTWQFYGWFSSHGEMVHATALYESSIGLYIQQLLAMRKTICRSANVWLTPDSEVSSIGTSQRTVHSLHSGGA